MISSRGDYKLIQSMNSRWKIHRFNSASFALILIGLSLVQLSLVHVAESDSGGALDGDLDDIADVDRDDDVDDLPPMPPTPSNNSTKSYNDIAKSPDSSFPGNMSKTPIFLRPDSLIPQSEVDKSRFPPEVYSESPPQTPNLNELNYPTVEFDRISVSKPTQPLVFSSMLSKNIELLHKKLLDQVAD